MHTNDAWVKPVPGRCCFSMGTWISPLRSSTNNEMHFLFLLFPPPLSPHLPPLPLSLLSLFLSSPPKARLHVGSLSEARPYSNSGDNYDHLFPETHSTCQGQRPDQAMAGNPKATACVLPLIHSFEKDSACSEARKRLTLRKVRLTLRSPATSCAPTDLVLGT
jgi:hypothetical protein